MPENLEPYDFTKFPRGRLAMQIPRRRLWSALVTEMQVSVGKSEGGRAWKLEALGDWTDTQLAGVVPVMINGCQITIKEGFVWGQPPEASDPAQLFPLKTPAMAAFNRMNGEITLGENARSLGRETGWDDQRSFAYVRGLFLWLVLARVCFPKE
jgi:hypothetical protein